MSITLTKPEQQDVYNIDVFNENSTKIEEAVNENIINIEELNSILETKYNIHYITQITTNLNILADFEDGIYYLTVKPTVGTLPSDLPEFNNILLITNNINDQTQTIITSNAKIYQRNITVDNVTQQWQIMTTTINNTLLSTSESEALSAKQGKLLNDIKINILYQNSTIDFNNVTSGIYVCEETSVSGDIPDFMFINASGTDNKFLFESYGKINEELTIQKAFDAITQTQGLRFGYNNTSDTWIWTQWKDISGGSAILPENAEIIITDILNNESRLSASSLKLLKNDVLQLNLSTDNVQASETMINNFKTTFNITTIYSGTEEPDNTIGQNGDVYIKYTP